MIAMVDYLNTGNLEHRANQLRIVPQRSFLFYSSQAIGPGATHQPHDYRFNLIIACVRSQNNASCASFGDSLQKSVAYSAGNSLEIPFLGLRDLSDSNSFDKDGQV